MFGIKSKKKKEELVTVSQMDAFMEKYNDNINTLQEQLDVSQKNFENIEKNFEVAKKEFKEIINWSNETAKQLNTYSNKITENLNGLCDKVNELVDCSNEDNDEIACLLLDMVRIQEENARLKRMVVRSNSKLKRRGTL